MENNDWKPWPPHENVRFPIIVQVYEVVFDVGAGGGSWLSYRHVMYNWSDDEWNSRTQLSRIRCGLMHMNPPFYEPRQWKYYEVEVK